jgi:hypothetical protein
MAHETDNLQLFEPLEGRYANYLQVGHNAFEIVIEFGQFYPEDDTPQIHTRIVTNPMYAKTFSITLQESIDEYEQTFGVIPVSPGPNEQRTTPAQQKETLQKEEEKCWIK